MLRPLERPAVLASETHKVVSFHNGVESVQYITITLHNGHPFEVFATGQSPRGDSQGDVGSGSCQKADYEAVCRLTSLALRLDPSLIGEVAQQLRGISCHPTFVGDGRRVASFADGLAQLLDSYVEKEIAV